MGSCEMGQYSCTKLLREIEAVDSEAEHETSDTVVEDVEMVCLADEVCAEISSGKWLKDIPEDIYTLPNMEQCPVDQVVVEKEVMKHEPADGKKKVKKENWGPVLVEKRPTRVRKDERTVLEKAQDRKKKANLEVTQGNTQNSFALLADHEVLHMARETDISLGTGVVSEEQSILDILDKDRVRKVEFDKLCVNCKVDSNEDRVELVNNGGASGEDAPCTPDAQIIRS
jgi:hypothetical protein